MTDEAARCRLAELLWYADNNIALPDEELVEVEKLAAEFGVKLAWRYFELNTGELRDGRFHQKSVDR